MKWSVAKWKIEHKIYTFLFYWDKRRNSWENVNLNYEESWMFEDLIQLVKAKKLIIHKFFCGTKVTSSTFSLSITPIKNSMYFFLPVYQLLMILNATCIKNSGIVFLEFTICFIFSIFKNMILSHKWTKLFVFKKKT